MESENHLFTWFFLHSVTYTDSHNENFEWQTQTLFLQLCVVFFFITIIFVNPSVQKTEKTQKKEFWEPRSVRDERCVLQKHEMASCHQSWQETNTSGHSGLSRRSCTLVWQVAFQITHKSNNCSKWKITRRGGKIGGSGNRFRSNWYVNAGPYAPG